MDFSEVVHTRRSIRGYKSGQDVTDSDLHRLFEHVVLCPSAFNLQHWAFVVVRDPAIKKKLRAQAWNQEQVENAPAVVIVCGKLDAHEDAAHIYEETPPAVQERVVPMIHNFYTGKPELLRDEAIRSGAMAAMTLMFAAKHLGLDTGPMIGFDPEGVAQLLRIPPNHIPVMMIVLGYGDGNVRPRAYRRPLHEVVRSETFDGAGLGNG